MATDSANERFGLSAAQSCSGAPGGSNAGVEIGESELQEWLDYQQKQHPKSIAMGLDRVRQVAARMQVQCPNMLRPAPLIITVAGTNGKGSTVALLRSVLSAHGLRVGSYTSPHILRYQERVELAERYATAIELCHAFAAIETARNAQAEATPLTFFEYGTLAGLWLFAHSKLDAVVLEVGLGGRLDAVNIVDADAVILTTVDLDHQDFLGDTRESIGAEKAGVFRAKQIAVYAEAEATAVRSVLAEAQRLSLHLLRPGVDYHVEQATQDYLSFAWRDQGVLELPWPTALRAPVQRHNAGAVLALLQGLQDRGRVRLRIDAIAEGMRNTKVQGRLQCLRNTPNQAEVWLDVAHNPQAAHSLAQWLHANPIAGKTRVVFGALQDKDCNGVVRELAPYVSAWYLTGLTRESPRGLDVLQLVARVRGVVQGEIQSFNDISETLAAALQDSGSSDRVLVFGSFVLVSETLKIWQL